MLTVKERMTLDFEGQWWKHAGVKEAAIREIFTESATTYYLRLNALIDRDDALTHNPLLVKRLQRMRAARQLRRRANTAGFKI